MEEFYDQPIVVYMYNLGGALRQSVPLDVMGRFVGDVVDGAPEAGHRFDDVPV